MKKVLVSMDISIPALKSAPITRDFVFTQEELEDTTRTQEILGRNAEDMIETFQSTYGDELFDTE